MIINRILKEFYGHDGINNMTQTWRLAMEWLNSVDGRLVEIEETVGYGYHWLELTVEVPCLGNKK